MAANTLPRVPEGLRDLMKAYTKDVLREKPTNLYEYSSDYFERLAAKRGQRKSENVRFEPVQSYEIIMKNRIRQQVPISFVFNMIPDNLTDLIKKFIKAVLKEKPENLLQFAVQYFQMLRNAHSPRMEYTKYSAYEKYMQDKGNPREKKCTCGRLLVTEPSVEPTASPYGVQHLRAVCIIQKYMRKYLKEKRLKSQEKQEVYSSQDYMNAIYVIQRQFRHYLTKKRALKANEKKNRYDSVKYMNAIIVIQRHSRRYLRKRKDLKRPLSNNGNSAAEAVVGVGVGVGDNPISLTTAAFIIQRAFRNMVKTRRAKRHINAELDQDDDVNDNASEAASYTSASTALLSTESACEHADLGGTNFEEVVHQQTIQEDEEVENDNTNNIEYMNEALKPKVKSISSNGSGKTLEESEGKLKLKDIYKESRSGDSQRSSETPKKISNPTENIISNIIKNEAALIAVEELSKEETIGKAISKPEGLESVSPSEKTTEVISSSDDNVNIRRQEVVEEKGVSCKENLEAVPQSPLKKQIQLEGETLSMRPSPERSVDALSKSSVEELNGAVPLAALSLVVAEPPSQANDSLEKQIRERKETRSETPQEKGLVTIPSIEISEDKTDSVSNDNVSKSILQDESIEIQSQNRVSDETDNQVEPSTGESLEGTREETSLTSNEATDILQNDESQTTENLSSNNRSETVPSPLISQSPQGTSSESQVATMVKDRRKSAEEGSSSSTEAKNTLHSGELENKDQITEENPITKDVSSSNSLEAVSSSPVSQSMEGSTIESQELTTDKNQEKSEEGSASTTIEAADALRTGDSESVPKMEVEQPIPKSISSSNSLEAVRSTPNLATSESSETPLTRIDSGSAKLETVETTLKNRVASEASLESFLAHELANLTSSESISQQLESSAGKVKDLKQDLKILKVETENDTEVSPALKPLGLVPSETIKLNDEEEVKIAKESNLKTQKTMDNIKDQENAVNITEIKESVTDQVVDIKEDGIKKVQNAKELLTDTVQSRSHSLAEGEPSEQSESVFRPDSEKSKDELESEGVIQQKVKSATEQNSNTENSSASMTNQGNDYSIEVNSLQTVLNNIKEKYNQDEGGVDNVLPAADPTPILTSSTDVIEPDTTKIASVKSESEDPSIEDSSNIAVSQLDDKREDDLILSKLTQSSELVDPLQEIGQSIKIQSVLPGEDDYVLVLSSDPVDEAVEENVFKPEEIQEKQQTSEKVEGDEEVTHDSIRSLKEVASDDRSTDQNEEEELSGSQSSSDQPKEESKDTVDMEDQTESAEGAIETTSLLSNSANLTDIQKDTKSSNNEVKPLDESPKEKTMKTPEEIITEGIDNEILKVEFQENEASDMQRIEKNSVDISEKSNDFKNDNKSNSEEKIITEVLSGNPLDDPKVTETDLRIDTDTSIRKTLSDDLAVFTSVHENNENKTDDILVEISNELSKDLEVTTSVEEQAKDKSETESSKKISSKTSTEFELTPSVEEELKEETKAGSHSEKSKEDSADVKIVDKEKLKRSLIIEEHKNDTETNRGECIKDEGNVDDRDDNNTSSKYEESTEKDDKIANESILTSSTEEVAQESEDSVVDENKDMEKIISSENKRAEETVMDKDGSKGISTAKEVEETLQLEKTLVGSLEHKIENLGEASAERTLENIKYTNIKESTAADVDEVKKESSFSNENEKLKEGNESMKYSPGILAVDTNKEKMSTDSENSTESSKIAIVQSAEKSEVQTGIKTDVESKESSADQEEDPKVFEENVSSDPLVELESAKGPFGSDNIEAKGVEISPAENKSSLVLTNPISESLQIKKLPTAKDKQPQHQQSHHLTTVSSSGRLVNVPVAELQLKSFRTASDGGHWYDILHDPIEDSESIFKSDKVVEIEDNSRFERSQSIESPERRSRYVYGEEPASKEVIKPKQSVAFFISFDGDDGKASFKIPKRFLRPKEPSSDDNQKKKSKNPKREIVPELSMEPLLTDDTDEDLIESDLELGYPQYGSQKLQTIHELNENESANELRLDVDDGNEMKTVASEINFTIEDYDQSQDEGLSNIVKDNATDPSQDFRRKRSAQIIQRAYKEYISRKYQKPNEREENSRVKDKENENPKKKSKSSLNQDVAATRIQNAVRKFLNRISKTKTEKYVREYSNSEIRAAKRIQKMFRHYIKVKKDLENKEKVPEDSELKKTIDKVEEKSKKNLIEKHYNMDEMLAAIRIQKMFRNYRERKKTQPKIDTNYTETEILAAIRIQKMFRNYMQRSKLKGDEEIMKTNVNMKLNESIPKHYQKDRNYTAAEIVAAIQIQKIFRKYITQKKQRISKFKDTYKDGKYNQGKIRAAIRIQKMFRNYIQRRNEETRKEKKDFEIPTDRIYTKSEMMAAILIQKMFRKYIQSKRLDRSEDISKATSATSLITIIPNTNESHTPDTSLPELWEEVMPMNTMNPEMTSAKSEWFVGSQRIMVNPKEVSDMETDFIDFSDPTVHQSQILVDESKLTTDIGNIGNDIDIIESKVLAHDNGDSNNLAGSSFDSSELLGELVLAAFAELEPEPTELSAYQLVNDFLTKEIEFSAIQAPYPYTLLEEVQEEECIRKSVSLSDINDDEADKDAMDEATSRIMKPVEVIEKMSQRRSSETREKLKEEIIEPVFDEPIIRPMSSLQEQSSFDIEDGDIIIYNRLQRDETRESSAQSESVVFGPDEMDDDQVFNSDARTQLSRHYTIAGEDPHVIFRSVTIDETVKYIVNMDGNEDETSGTGNKMNSGISFCLDDETSENIRKKMLAYSLSEGDSDYYDPTKIIKDDFHIDTAMTDAMDTSTETESTIVSAATKIQAGARGFLARRRLRRASAGTKSSTQDVDTKASFGNDAISESLERFIEEEAAKKIQSAYRFHSKKQKKQANAPKSGSLESSLAAKRLTLQRGDALRNDSNSTPEDENSSSTSGGQSQKERLDNKLGKENVVVRYKRNVDMGLKWPAIRQNSMPVQIDCEVLRPIPKHMRRRIKSAEANKKKNRK